MYSTSVIQSKASDFYTMEKVAQILATFSVHPGHIYILVLFAKRVHLGRTEKVAHIWATFSLESTRFGRKSSEFFTV